MKLNELTPDVAIHCKTWEEYKLLEAECLKLRYGFLPVPPNIPQNMIHLLVFYISKYTCNTWDYYPQALSDRKTIIDFSYLETDNSLSNLLKLYVDMDGTIVEWQSDKTIEEVATKGYFRDIPVVKNVLSAVKQLIAENNIEVYILSSVFNDGHSIEDKKHWLRKNIPEIKLENMVFVPYSEKKADYVPVNSSTYLLDDLSKNLHEWERAGGIGIKAYNGINGNNGTWTGFSIHSAMTPDKLYKQLIGIIK